MLSNIINFSIQWKNNTDPEDGHTKKHSFAILFSNHQYMYQSVNMTIPICHCLRAISLHSDLLRSVIPCKCSRGMQVFMDNCNRYTQTPQSRLRDACIQAVTTCKNVSSQYNSSYPSLGKGFSNLVNEEKFWENFANYLESQGQARDFVHLANGLKSGAISPHNLSWLSGLHMGRYCACQTACNM